MHSNWRDCDAWRKQKLPMNTTSNEASKLYDVSLSQIAGWYENKQYGGLVSSLDQMVNSDPNFILGHCLKTGTELFGTSITTDFYQQNIQTLLHKSNSLANSLTKREHLHVNAIDMLSSGDLPSAANCWEEILIDHPTDMMAIKFAHTVYFYMGRKQEMRDSVARVLPSWKKDLPLYNYLHGLHAFGLTQTNELDKAEKSAFKALELNRLDGWASHAIAHVNEYRSTFDNGIKFLLDTEKDWVTCDLISGHNYWHLCLYYIEKNDYESIMNIMENNQAFKDPKSSIDLINSASLLIRLKLNGFNDKHYLSTKFNDLKKVFQDRVSKHGHPYSDSHMALVLAMCGTQEEKSMYLDSLNEFIDMNKFKISSYLRSLNKEISTKLLKALIHFGENEFEQAVDLLYPIRYELYRIGGSNAQRDVFSLILIESCLSSSSRFHNKIGQALLYERFSEKSDSNLACRIAARFSLNELYEND